MYFDTKFRKLIQDLSIINNKILIDNIIKLLDDKINYIPLKEYFMKNKENYIFNKFLFKENIKEIYSKSVFFVIDYEQEYNGGKKKIKFNNNSFDDNKLEFYINSLKNNFWQSINHEEKIIFDKLSNFEVFENRLPKNKIEKLICINNTSYRFFNYTEWSKYYDKLMKHFFPQYELNKKISNTNKKRYSYVYFNKKEYSTSIYWDKGLFLSELKKGYLELRPMNIEIISNKINKYYPEEDYLIYNDETFLVRLGISQGFANLLTGRIGFYKSDENQLKKDFYLFFKIYANNINIYLEYAEYILELDEFNL